MSQTTMPDLTLDSSFCLELSDREAEALQGGIQRAEPALVDIPPEDKPLVLLFANPFAA